MAFQRLFIIMLLFSFSGNLYADNTRTPKAGILATCARLVRVILGLPNYKFSPIEERATQYGFKPLDTYDPKSNTPLFGAWKFSEIGGDNPHFVAEFSQSAKDGVMPSLNLKYNGDLPKFDPTKVFQVQESNGRFVVHENWIRHEGKWTLKTHFFKSKAAAMNFTNSMYSEKNYLNILNGFLVNLYQLDPKSGREIQSLANENTLNPSAYRYLIDQMLKPENQELTFADFQSQPIHSPESAKLKMLAREAKLKTLLAEIKEVYTMGIPPLRKAGFSDAMLNLLTYPYGDKGWIEHQRTKARLEARAELRKNSARDQFKPADHRALLKQKYAEIDAQSEQSLALQKQVQDAVLGGLPLNSPLSPGNASLQINREGHINIRFNLDGMSEFKYAQLTDTFRTIKKNGDLKNKVLTLYGQRNQPIGYYVLKASDGATYEGYVFPAITTFSNADDPGVISIDSVNESMLDAAKQRAEAFLDSKIGTKPIARQGDPESTNSKVQELELPLPGTGYSPY